MTAPAQAPICAHNRFPTIVVAPDGSTTRDARTVITCPDSDQPARLMIWTAPGDPFVDEPIDLDRSTIGRPRADWWLATPAGMWQVQPGRTCGCGSRVKRWEPFTPMLMGRLP